MANPEVDRRLLQELELMGFPTNRATRALYSTGNCSLENALNWVIEHENDSDIDKIPQVPIDIKIEDGNLFALPAEVKMKAQKLWEGANHNVKKFEELKTSQTEVEKKAPTEIRDKEPKETEEERESGILSMKRTKRVEAKRIREKQLKEDQERTRTNGELKEAKRQLEESQRKRSLAQADLDKEEDRRARERIRRRIEDDKAERRMRLKLPNENSKDPQPIIVHRMNKKKEAATPLVKPEQLQDCLRLFKRNHKDENEKVNIAFQTLLKIVGNIARNPNEDKFRRIRLSNRTFQESVGKFQQLVQFLELCGFEKTEEGEELCLLMPRDKTDVRLLRMARDELHSAMSNPYFGLLSK